MEPKKEIRGIIRIAGQDLKGEMKLGRALSRIKGVGVRLSSVFSNIIMSSLKLSEDTLVGELSDDDISKIEEILTTPGKYHVPSYLLNRRNEVEVGIDGHKIANDLTYAVKQDIERDKTIFSWRGYRHQFGQKVRGQRTRTTGRTGMSVGVLRKAIARVAAASAAPAAATTAAPVKEEKKEEKKPTIAK